MKFDILNRFNSHIVFSFEAPTRKLVVEAAIREKADLSGANLSNAHLSGANLSNAHLSGADLSGADLSGAYLSGADLSYTNLSGANLSDAHLSGANLFRANLPRADLSHTTLSGANLSSANLSGANLSGAHIYCANLYDANLSGADLSGANLSNAYLYRAKLSDADLSGADMSMFNIVAQGTLTVWKQLACGNIAELEIPSFALRVNAYSSRKCRADQAKVISITAPNGKACAVVESRSKHDKTFVYRVGSVVQVSDFCADPRIKCAAGIHFFITREEAVGF
jgi:hypothetical protein